MKKDGKLSTCNWLDLETLGSLFNIEVLNACQMPFWSPKKFFLFVGGQFTKLCFAKFPPFIVKASPKTACHKIQWLQFVNRNIARLQSWHSSRHFQNPITPTISTQQLWLRTDYNFGLASTTICEHGFSKQIWMKSDHKCRLKLEILDAFMWVSLCGLPKEYMDWAKTFDTWKLTKNRRTLPLEFDGN